LIYFSELNDDEDDDYNGDSSGSAMMMDEGPSSINQPTFLALSPNEAADGGLLRSNHHQFQVSLN
jgi:hypothetical protein